MKKDLKDIKVEDLRPYLVPIGTVVIIIILSYVSFNYFWGNISDIRGEISDSNKEKNILEDRLNVLRTNQIGLQESQEYVTTALPTNNASILAMNQIFNTLAKYPTTRIADLSIKEPEIKNLEPEEETASVLNKVQIEFVVEGEYEEVASFITSLNEVAPVMAVEEIIIESGFTDTSAKIKVNSYYSLPPLTIPAITTPIDDLSDSEKAVISIIKEFTQPTVGGGNINSLEETGKVNPFE